MIEITIIGIGLFLCFLAMNVKTSTVHFRILKKYHYIDCYQGGEWHYDVQTLKKLFWYKWWHTVSTTDCGEEYALLQIEHLKQKYNNNVHQE